MKPRAGFIALATATMIGCVARVPPEDLVTARASFACANEGLAGQLDPIDLRAAREALDAAEQAFKEEGDTPRTRDLAYIADRRALIASAWARARKGLLEQRAILDAVRAQTLEVPTTSAPLGGANEEIADKRASQIAAGLASFAAVKVEPRGMVIIISGSLMFASTKSDLLPGAQGKLKEVADALVKQDAGAKVVVEGHMDSQGDQDLSQRRAQAVRDYLVTHGIAPDRVTAQGLGSTRPLAGNTSAEGNRRVEIVVRPGAP